MMYDNGGKIAEKLNRWYANLPFKCIVASRGADAQLFSLYEEKRIDIVVSSDKDFVLYGVPLASRWDCKSTTIHYYPRTLFYNK